MKAERIPPATVARLPIYIHGLRSLAQEGITLTSSRRLAEVTGVEAPQIRRDLAYLGALGTPGVGYRVQDLLREISRYLGLSRRRSVALVCCGNPGSALALSSGLAECNFQVAAVFDASHLLADSPLQAPRVLPCDRIAAAVEQLGIELAIIATPADTAQEVANRLVASGVTCLLNLAPTNLEVPAGVTVRNVDVAAEMQILSFEETASRLPKAHPETMPAVKRRAFSHLREGRHAAG